MTAEVVIFNKSAIALAADSAVSIEGNNSHKIYNNAEKLFALTKHHPIGVMIYGCNELTGVPWELIIKQYRKELGADSFQTVHEYAKSFISFAEKFYSLLPETYTTKFFQEFVYSIAIKTWDSIIEFLDIDFLILEEEELSSFLQAIQTITDLYEKMDFFSSFTDKDIEKIEESISDITTDVFNQFFEDEDNDTSNDIYVHFIRLCAIKIIKEDPFYKDISGLVFTGYGESEFFPQIIEMEVHGIIQEKIKTRDLTIEDKNLSGAGLQAFAQRDEVDAFMQGSCDSMNKKFNTCANILLDEAKAIIDSTIEELCEDPEQQNILKEKAEDNLIKKYNDMGSDLSHYIKTQHVDKVVQMIKHLPKNELAYMAESLVNLTAFKRKVSNDSDSVGGPIDVAVISKGDGFVWIKRKYYFPNNLNNSN